MHTVQKLPSWTELQLKKLFQSLPDVVKDHKRVITCAHYCYDKTYNFLVSYKKVLMTLMTSFDEVSSSKHSTPKNERYNSSRLGRYVELVCRICYHKNSDDEVMQYLELDELVRLEFVSGQDEPDNVFWE